MSEHDPTFLILKHSELFSSLPDLELQRLIDASSKRRYPKSATIFFQGARPDALYVVLRGQVRIVSTSQEGSVLSHRVIERGQIFGEIAVMDRQPRTSSARALPACEVLAISDAEFLALLEKHPRMTVRLAATLAGRIRSTTRLLEDSVFLSARDRVGKKLLELAGSHGRRDGERIVLEGVTHEGLAQMTGLHRVTVSNQITLLERRALVETGRRRLYLCDLGELEALCGGFESASPEKLPPV